VTSDARRLQYAACLQRCAFSRYPFQCNEVCGQRISMQLQPWQRPLGYGPPQRYTGGCIWTAEKLQNTKHIWTIIFTWQKSATKNCSPLQIAPTLSKKEITTFYLFHLCFAIFLITNFTYFTRVLLYF
jgi:hypothetical protein